MAEVLETGGQGVLRIKAKRRGRPSSSEYTEQI